MKKLTRLLLLCAACSACVSAQSIHYLDCAAGDDSGDSLTPQTAWKTLGRASTFTFQPGDSLLLKRGSTCSGMLAPKGSGDEGRPISLSAFGTGALPRIIGTGHEAGLKLQDQQHWSIANLDVTGGSPYGVLITGSVPHLKHFRITNVVIHDVTGEPKTKQSGLLVIGSDEKTGTVFDDIVIDGVTAYNSSQWAGIIVSAGPFNPQGGSPHGSDITIRNSIVHDVAGDGILLALAKNGLIEHNVSWNTGMQHTESIGTPNAIWEWECNQCTVQYNEGFFSDSPGVDGGVFDIDWGCHDNIVQYNFAHDSQGYCASIFGAEGEAGSSTNSIIRHNLCLDNGRSPRLASRQGAIYLSTWNRGKLKGVEIYNNTVLWDPPPDAPALVNEAEIEPGAPRMFSNNLIVSRSSLLARNNGTLAMDGNQYWMSGSTVTAWQYGTHTYTEIADLRSATGQESHGRIENARLNELLQPAAALQCPAKDTASVDLYGNHIAAGQCMIGALLPVKATRNSGQHAERTVPDSLAGGTGGHRWTLVAILEGEGTPEASASRSQLVVLQSTLRQFAALRLHIQAIPANSEEDAAAVNWASDWNFGHIPLLRTLKAADARRVLGITESVGMALVSPERRVIRTWNGPVSAPELNLALRSLLGVPPGMQAHYR